MNNLHNWHNHIIGRMVMCQMGRNGYGHDPEPHFAEMVVGRNGHGPK